LVISDPKALDNAREDLEGLNGKISYIEDPYEASYGCDAIAVMTEWEIYRQLDYRKIFKSMTKLAFIFDGRNILDHNELFEIGFNVFPIGKPPQTHF
jgi:UDPglucose 6-dehydrogenase